MTDKLTMSVLGRSSHFTHSAKVLTELQNMILDGWRIDVNNRGIKTGVVLTRSKVRIPLYKEIEEEVPAELTDEEKLELLEKDILASEKMKKEDMTWYADKKGIEIPEDLKLPTQIRKHLKESIQQ